jgi:hypothetical protein
MEKARFPWLHSLKPTHYRVWVRTWGHPTYQGRASSLVYEGLCRPAVWGGAAAVTGTPTASMLSNRQSGRFVPQFPTRRALSEPITSGRPQSNGVTYDESGWRDTRSGSLVRP